jgi:hypothetical protein
VLGQLHATLRPGGVLFSSNPRGDGLEGWSGDRYGVFHDWEGWRGHMTAAGFVALTHYYRPTGAVRAAALAGRRVAKAEGLSGG